MREAAVVYPVPLMNDIQKTETSGLSSLKSPVDCVLKCAYLVSSLIAKAISLSLPFPSPSNASTALLQRLTDAARHRGIRRRAVRRNFQPTDTLLPQRDTTGHPRHVGTVVTTGRKAQPNSIPPVQCYRGVMSCAIVGSSRFNPCSDGKGVLYLSAALGSLFVHIRGPFGRNQPARKNLKPSQLKSSSTQGAQGPVAQAAPIPLTAKAVSPSEFLYGCWPNRYCFVVTFMLKDESPAQSCLRWSAAASRREGDTGEAAATN